MNTEEYYETYWSPEGFSPTVALHSSIKKLLQTHVGVGTKCLDIGCGDGNTYASWLLELGCQYEGVDVSNTAIQAARARGLDARKIDSATALPFPAEQFDVAVCIELLEHLFEPQKAVAEIFRVLRPGGVLIVTVPNVAYWRRRADLAVLGRWNPIGDSLSAKKPWRDPHIRFFTPKTLSHMLLDCGFNQLEVGGYKGTFSGDLPWVGTRFRQRQASKLYQLAERAFPSLFGYGVYATGKKHNS